MPGAAGSGGMETSTETALENPLKKLSIHGGKLGGAARKAGRISRPENRKNIDFSPSAPKFLSFMNPADLLFLAFALSVDAFVVAFSFGLIIKKNRFPQRHGNIPGHRGAANS